MQENDPNALLGSNNGSRFPETESQSKFANKFEHHWVDWQPVIIATEG